MSCVASSAVWKCSVFLLNPVGSDDLDRLQGEIIGVHESCEFSPSAIWYSLLRIQP